MPELTIPELEAQILDHPQWQSHLPSRQQQDPRLLDQICTQALNLLTGVDLTLTGDSFFVGAVDVLAGQEGAFYVLEANGGSTRGFWSLPEAKIEAIYRAYGEALQWVDPDAPLIIIGHVDDDVLLYERLLLAERLRAWSGKSVRLCPYSQLVPALNFSENWVTYANQRVALLIGDGVARRHPKLSEHPCSRTLIVNRIFPLTDSKALTYHVVAEHAAELGNFGYRPLRFWEGFSEKSTLHAMKTAFESCKSILIKPHGGSGGCGLQWVTTADAIASALQKSQAEFHAKFGADRSPFPYTISETIEGRTWRWQGKPYHFDLKIYIVRQNNTLVPVGVKIRRARVPAGESTASLRTNLTYGGGLAAERAGGINPQTLEQIGLSTADVARMVAGATLLVKRLCDVH
ncbi:MAG: hypothetical protein D6675_00895 [Gemmatimonadetes bacterium]|nr:MAG: hypothetical protein D6675_00895 [Gemmatimonadota bacterium]